MASGLGRGFFPSRRESALAAYARRGGSACLAELVPSAEDG
ncbi:MAG TPA: hypothetical protein VIM41_00860 [Gammaproteobacteria bacterium]